MFFMRALQQQKRRLAAKVEREKNVLTALSGLVIKILELRSRPWPRHNPR
jgi:hypothetical protein